MRFLIVEDEVAQSESLKMVLDALGHQTYLAADAGIARKLIELHPPDVVVLDLLLPGGGASFLRWLRIQPNMASLPVVVSTGLPPEARADLSGLGPYMVLTKPWQPDSLLAAVAEMSKQGGA